MLLACDVGNSSVKIAIYDNDERVAFGLYPKKDFSSSTDILSLTTKSNIRFDQLEGVIISSVVPDLTKELVDYTRNYIRIEPIVISNNTNLPITISSKFNENIGPDILTMAAYAYSKYKSEILLISLGTATAFSYVDRDGVLLGCAFAPGFKSFSTSLSEKSVLLPTFTPTHQTTYLATNTIDAMSIGAFNGFCGMINVIKTNILREYGVAPTVILCGGYSDIVMKYITKVDYQEKDFVLSGLNYLYRHQ